MEEVGAETGGDDAEDASPGAGAAVHDPYGEPLEFEFELPEMQPPATGSAAAAAEAPGGTGKLPDFDYEPEEIVAGLPREADDEDDTGTPAAGRTVYDDSELDFELADAGSFAADDFEFDELQIEDDTGAPTSAISFEQIDDDDLDLRDAFTATADSGDDDELVIADDADQMATKLDLARAYLEMNDRDGAGVILQEVLMRGNPVQQQEARELLARID
jgi:pilus assembly protein FimV